MNPYLKLALGFSARLVVLTVSEGLHTQTGKVKRKITAVLRSFLCFWALSAFVVGSFVQAQVPPDHSIVQGQGNPTVYLIDGGKKRSLGSAELFEACGFTWTSIRMLPRSQVDAIQVGAPFTACSDLTAPSQVPDKQLIKGKSSAFYVMDGVKKRHIISPTVLTGCGFSWQDVWVLPDEYVQGLYSGPVFDASCAFTAPYVAWQKQMQDLCKNQHSGFKVSVEFKDLGSTVDAQCWYGDGFNTPSNGGVIGTYTKP